MQPNVLRTPGMDQEKGCASSRLEQVVDLRASRINFKPPCPRAKTGRMRRDRIESGKVSCQHSLPVFRENSSSRASRLPAQLPSWSPNSARMVWQPAGFRKPTDRVCEIRMVLATKRTLVQTSQGGRTGRRRHDHTLGIREFARHVCRISDQQN